ncbi:MAG: hypothetical protein NTY10_03475 [Candidatus Omnitrophica bacterium]|nr:hypothetical protein [Candidatus Omnitrophota bacterium]
MKKISVYTAALVALILFPSFIGAQSLTWNETNAVRIEQNDSAGSFSFSPQIAISGNKAVSVWQQKGRNGMLRIYSNYTTIDGTGAIAWDTTKVDTVSNDDADASEPQIAISGDAAGDTVVAVWQQGSDIYSNYAIIDGVGAVTWNLDIAAPIEEVAGDAYYPQIAISGNTVVAVWVQYANPAYYIYSTYTTDGGRNWHSAERIDNSGGNAYYPQIAISGNTIVAIWIQYDWTNSPAYIYSNYATIDGGGVLTWNDTAVRIEDNNNNASDPPTPQIAILGGTEGDTVVAVWEQYDSNGKRLIYSNYAIIDGAGAVVWDTTKVDTVSSAVGYAYRVQIATSGNTAVAVWDQYVSGANTRIYSNYSTIDGAGAVIWDTTTVDTVSDDVTNAYNSQIAISGNNIVAVWRQSNESSHYNIYSNYTTMGGDGAVAWDETNAARIENNIGWDTDNPQIAISGDTAVAVWEQPATDNKDRVYSNYAVVAPDSSANDNGSLPVGPLAAGISALLVWRKRRKQA